MAIWGDSQCGLGNTNLPATQARWNQEGLRPPNPRRRCSRHCRHQARHCVNSSSVDVLQLAVSVGFLFGVFWVLFLKLPLANKRMGFVVYWEGWGMGWDHEENMRACVRNGREDRKLRETPSINWNSPCLLSDITGNISISFFREKASCASCLFFFSFLTLFP